MWRLCKGLVEVKIVTGGNWVEMYGKGGGGRKDGWKSSGVR